jgi:hypothetical protein
MKQIYSVVTSILLLSFSLFSQPQQAAVSSPNANATVPPLVKFSGTLNDSTGKPLNGVVGVTFSLYQDERGGSPLWLETQNVTADTNGHYSVMLGSTTSTGLPADIFAAGEARWIAVQVQGQSESPRVLLLSVPYALKAGDAQTLGGLPASAFVLAAPTVSNVATATEGASASSSSAAVTPATGADVTTSGGTVNTLPLFSTATNIQNSILTQTGSGTTGKIGINNATPSATLDVVGGATIRGILASSAMGTATAEKGFDSQPQDFVASVFNSSTAAAVPQKFQWQAEPAANDTATASGTMNLLYASGTDTPAETGLKISSKGLFTFAAGQSFPGTGAGTITGVTAGTGLTGGGTSGAITLKVNTSTVPLLSAANTFVGNQTITGNLAATGNITATGAITGQTGAFSANSSNPVETITQSGAGVGLVVKADHAVYGIQSTATLLGIYATATAAGGDGVSGNSTNGVGVYGYDNAPNGSSVGVTGQSTSSTGFGVVGELDNTTTSGVVAGVLGTSTAQYSDSGPGFGIVGQSPTMGVYGASSGVSNNGQQIINGVSQLVAGVWGDTGANSNDSYFGVLGTGDDNPAGFFENNSLHAATLSAYNESTASGAPVFQTEGGDDTSFCTIDVNANLTCSGKIGGAFDADGGARKVSLYAVQSPENWFEDFGSGTLSNGAARVALDPTFASTVNTTTDYHVFLTPKGDCKGLYVANETATGFEVRELGGGHSGVAFDYRIVAKRNGFESVRLADVTEKYQRMEKQQQRRQERVAQPPAAHHSNQSSK